MILATSFGGKNCSKNWGALVAILLGVGLQYKTADGLAAELELQSSQLLGLFNRMMRRFVQFLLGILKQAIEQRLARPHTAPHVPVDPAAQGLQEELDKAAKELRVKQKTQLEKLKRENLSLYAIKGSEEEWGKSLAKGSKNLVSVKIGEKRSNAEEVVNEKPPVKKKRKKNKSNFPV